jgi:hypothetical protein
MSTTAKRAAVKSAPISGLFADALNEADAAAAVGRKIRFMQLARSKGVGAPHFFIGKSPYYLKSELRDWAISQTRPLAETMRLQQSKEAARL